MKILIRKDVVKEIEKSCKYIKRWFSNGKWHYKYPAEYQTKSNRTETKISIAKKTPLISGIKPLSHATEQQIDEALVNLSLYARDGKLKCPALGNHSVYITGRTQEHIKETKGTIRTFNEMQHKAKYIPFIPEILKNGRICEKSSSSKGVIYGIIGQIEYFDEGKQKTVKESVELAINYDKETRKYVFSFANFIIKKSILSSMDFKSTSFLACPVGACKAEAFSTTNINVYPIEDDVKKIINKSIKQKGRKTMIVVRLDSEIANTDVEKSRIPKYIKKIPLGNGGYKYIYYDNKKLQKKIDFTLCKTLNCTKANAAKKGGQFLKDWQEDWKNYPEKTRIWALNNERVYLKTKGSNKISLFHFTHKGGGDRRTSDEIYQRALLLPIAKEMLENINKCRVYQVRKSSDKVEYELVGKTKINGKNRIISVIISKFYGQKKVYISAINKAVSECDTAYITDVYFTDPKTLTSQIKLNLGIPVDESHQSKTLCENALTLPGKMQGGSFWKLCHTAT